MFGMFYKKNLRQQSYRQIYYWTSKYTIYYCISGQVSEFPCSCWLNSVNRKGYNVGSPEFNVRTPCQQMATRLLLFIKFGSLVDPRKSISADKFLPGVHIKCIFFLGVHNYSANWREVPFPPVGAAQANMVKLGGQSVVLVPTFPSAQGLSLMTHLWQMSDILLWFRLLNFFFSSKMTFF